MVIPKKYWLISYGVSIIVFGTGIAIWVMALLYQPSEPLPQPPQPVNLGPNPTVYPLGRYQSLMTGRLFFGGPDPTFDPVVVQFKSKLILWGVIKDGHAVIGVDPNSNRDTKLVKAGDIVEGETIVTIGDGFVVVKNQTGQGRVKMVGE